MRLAEARGAGGWAVAIGTLGVGFLPGAPGTYASLLTVVLLWIGAVPAGPPRTLGLLGTVLVLSVLGTWAARRLEASLGEDPRCIVVDEVAGMLVTAVGVPWDPLHLLVAFLLFRALDVVKPPPIYQLQALPGGVGVIVDDLAAGLYGFLILVLAQAWLPGF